MLNVIWEVSYWTYKVNKIVLLTKLLVAEHNEVIFEYIGGANEGDGDNKFGIFDSYKAALNKFVFIEPS